MLDIFGGMFDIDSDGTLDAGERALSVRLSKTYMKTMKTTMRMTKTMALMTTMMIVTITKTTIMIKSGVNICVQYISPDVIIRYNLCELW